MKWTVWGLFSLILIGGMGVKSFDVNNDQDILTRLLPREVSGWKAEERDKSYDPQTIFDYINGAGEVYRSYNFKRLLVRRFTRKGQPDIIADVFDMESSQDAYGVFTHDLEGEEAGIGQGSTYKGGLLSFWKGCLFVSLYAEEETPEAREALFALGRSAAASIKKEGQRPEIVSLLPSEGLEGKDTHYFHNHMILNYHYYVSDENILLLDQQTEAALGGYKGDGEEYYLLLVRYPGRQKALQAYESFLKSYMPEAGEEGLVQTEDLKWTAARVREDMLVILFDAPSYFSVKDILEKMERNLKSKEGREKA